MPRLILSSAKVSFWGLDIIFLSPIFICPSLFRFILIWPFLLLLFRFSFKHFSIRKMQEACRADPSPSQEHKQSISVYPEGWDSAFFTSPIYSLQISIRVSEQSSSCTCSHIAIPCLKKNRKVRQKNTPHCSLSYRTPAIENHHKDYGNTMCCACKPPGAHAALHPQAVRSTRLPLEHLTPLHTKPNASWHPKAYGHLSPSQVQKGRCFHLISVTARAVSPRTGITALRSPAHRQSRLPAAPSQRPPLPRRLFARGRGCARLSPPTAFPSSMSAQQFIYWTAAAALVSKLLSLRE